MLSQHFFQDITETIIIIEASYLGNHSDPLEGFIVEFVYQSEMRIGNHHIGQLLDISQTMSKAVKKSASFQFLPVVFLHTE